MGDGNARVSALLAQRRGVQTTPAPSPLPENDVADDVEVDYERRDSEVDIRVTTRVQAIVGGALMEITVLGMSPERVPEWIRSKDATAQFQTEFPKRGFGGGAKETKSGILMGLTIKGGKYPGVEMTVADEDGENAASVTVSKKKLPEWPAEFAKIGQNGDIAKCTELLEGKDGAFPVLMGRLNSGKPIVIKYSVYEGRNFYDAMEVTA